MTNPNLTVIVPIAPGESDVEFLEEEEISESSEDEDKVSHISRYVFYTRPELILMSLFQTVFKSYQHGQLHKI